MCLSQHSCDHLRCSVCSLVSIAKLRSQWFSGLLYWPVSLLLIKTVQKEAKALNVVCHQATHRSGTMYMRYVQPENVNTIHTHRGAYRASYCFLLKVHMILCVQRTDRGHDEHMTSLHASRRDLMVSFQHEAQWTPLNWNCWCLQRSPLMVWRLISKTKACLRCFHMEGIWLVFILNYHSDSDSGVGVVRGITENVQVNVQVVIE